MTGKLLNILLADDDQDDCYFFGKALKQLPMSTELTTVRDGDELIQRLIDETQNLPDVLFLDINMPRKTGIECIVEIKSMIRLKDLPIVMYSTSNEPEKIKALFKNGVNVYIHKPNDFTELKQVIYHALPISTENELFPKNHVKFILNA